MRSVSAVPTNLKISHFAFQKTPPTVVIHGADDPLVPIEAGRDTAANIAGAELIEIPGVGHLPAVLYSRIVDAIESVAKRARVAAS